MAETSVTAGGQAGAFVDAGSFVCGDDCLFVLTFRDADTLPEPLAEIVSRIEGIRSLSRSDVAQKLLDAQNETSRPADAAANA